MGFCRYLCSFLLLASFLFASIAKDGIEGPCRSWYRSCKESDLKRQWMCTSVEEYIAYTTKGCSDDETDPPIPVPPPGQCAIVNDRCEFTTSAPKCGFGKTLDSMCKYQCMEVNGSTHNDSNECKYSRYPPPDHLCVPMNGKCQEYNPCNYWGGIIFEPFYCGTFDDYYRYIFGHLPEPPLPVYPLAPGECIIQNDTCSWSNCTRHLDQCLFYYMCGSAYDMAVYYAMPPHPCPVPPANYTPPPPIGECQLNLTKGVCDFEKREGRKIGYRIPEVIAMKSEIAKENNILNNAELHSSDKKKLPYSERDKTEGSTRNKVT